MLVLNFSIQSRVTFAGAWILETWIPLQLFFYLMLLEKQMLIMVADLFFAPYMEENLKLSKRLLDVQYQLLSQIWYGWLCLILNIYYARYWYLKFGCLLA